MEGVEDIPGTALTEGITWGWESFPQYLDVVEKRQFAVDVGSQVAHGAVRAYAMGERGARNEPATADDIAAMAGIVREAIEAGALGFSTSRTVGHRAMDGEPVPGTYAAEDELFGLGRAMAAGGQAVFELAPAGCGRRGHRRAAKRELDWMTRLAAEIERPVSFALIQIDADPDLWREQLDLAADAHAARQPVVPADRRAAVRDAVRLPRPPRVHPPADVPQAARPSCGRDELAQRLADPAVQGRDPGRGRPAARPDQAVRRACSRWSQHSLEQPLRPRRSARLRADPRPHRGGDRARPRRGPAGHAVRPDAARTTRRAMLMLPFFNYADGNHDAIREMLTHPAGVSGLSDGGAHCGLICDASYPTFLLTHWARDRHRGEKLPLEYVVRKQTHDTASAVRPHRPRRASRSARRPTSTSSTWTR